MSKRMFRGLIALIIVFVLVVVWGIGSNGFKENNPVKWSWWQSGKSDNFDEDNSGSTSTEDNSNVITPEVSEGSGITLTAALIPIELYSDYSISPLVESAYTVTATLSPENTTEKELLWSIAWGTQTGFWDLEEKGDVTDYVSLVPDGLSAMVALKKAFGTQILLTATAKNYPSVTATATFDYIQRCSLEDISAEDYNAITLSFSEDGSSTTRYTLLPGMEIGSVSGTVNITSATVQFTSDVWFGNDTNYKSAQSFFNGNAPSRWGSSVMNTFQFKTVPAALELNASTELTGHIGFDYSFFFTCSGGGSRAAAQTWSDLADYMKAYIKTVAAMSDVNDWGTVTLSGTYSYGEYYSTEVSCTIGLKGWNISPLIVPPSDVDIGDGSYYF